MLATTNTTRTSSLFLVYLTLAFLSGCEGMTIISICPPLHDAVKEGDRAKVRLLIDQGEDVDRKDYPPGKTPLHYAAY